MRLAPWLALACVLLAPSARAQPAPKAPANAGSALTPPPPPPPETERQAPPREIEALPPGGPEPTVRRPSAADAGVRILDELLIGALGEIGGGLVGNGLGLSLVGSQATGTAINIAGLTGLTLGTAVGTWGGVLIGGYLGHGDGNGLTTFLSALGGSTLALGLYVLTGPIGWNTLFFFALPLAAGMIGYELSIPSAASAPPAHASERSGPRVLPVVSLAPDGSAGLVGVIGRF